MCPAVADGREGQCHATCSVQSMYLGQVLVASAFAVTTVLLGRHASYLATIICPMQCLSYFVCILRVVYLALAVHLTLAVFLKCRRVCTLPVLIHSYHSYCSPCCFMKAEYRHQYYVTCAVMFCQKADRPVETDFKIAHIEETAASPNLGNGASLRHHSNNGLVSSHLTASVNAL